MREEQISLFNDNPEYDAFVAKFEPKKTTDDCYTPPVVYDAVADWVAEEYGVDRSSFVRPFYPDADYEAMDYPPGCVVVDNPPFSILSQIRRFYTDRGVPFFLFAPTLTLFSGNGEKNTFVAVGVGITYENGASVSTSFVTNMDTMAVRTAPELYRRVFNANEENVKAGKKELPKYSYPDEVITAAMVARWCKYGVEYSVEHGDCCKVSALDAQREAGKTIFGGGFLLSERAAAERAAAERAAAERAAAERAAATRWKLSGRERAICASLGDTT